VKPDKNKELMLAAGSKTGAYDIEAPDQWRWVMNHSADPQERGMAWVKSKTTAYLHESPFCVDEHGKPLYIEHMAVDLGWKPRTARNVLTELQSQGRIKYGKNRIWYCADIPQATQLNPNKRRKQGEEKYSIEGNYWTYVNDFIKELPEERRKPAEARLKACIKFRRHFLSDAMAAARSIVDQLEDTTLEEIGIPKKRLPKRRQVESRWLKLNLVAEPEFVHSQPRQEFEQTVEESIQTRYKPEIEGASLFTSTATETVVGRSVGDGAEEPPTYLPPHHRLTEVAPDPRRDPAFRQLVEVIEQIAVPEIGEKPSDAQYLEIFRHLDGATPEHYRQKLEAKKALGKLNSVMVLKHLADDCAKAKDKWKPPKKAATTAGKDDYATGVAKAFAERIRTGTL
jgi:hypothetical protein